MPRQARLDSPDTLHHVITRGMEKKEVVGNKCDRSDFGAQLAIVLMGASQANNNFEYLSNHFCPMKYYAFPHSAMIHWLQGASFSTLYCRKTKPTLNK